MTRTTTTWSAATRNDEQPLGAGSASAAPPAGTPSGRRGRAGLLRFALLTLAWWALTEGSGGWGFGLPLAAAAAAASLWLAPPARHAPTLARLPGFAAWFMWQSLVAGCDVARRTLAPALHLRPALVRVTLDLPDGAPTWWFMLTISLLPGTLSVRRDGREIELHCLDVALDAAEAAHDTERRIARLFAIGPLPPRSSGR